MSVVLAAAASAAPITPFTIYGGYFRGNTFTNRAGAGVHLAGPELGIQQSLLSLPLVGQVDVGASALFSGSGFGGGDSGNLYRLYAQYKSPTAGPNSIYGIAGLSFNWAQGSSFDSQHGIATEFGIGFPIKAPLPGAPGIGLEARYRSGSKSAFRGIGLGVTVSF